MCIHAALSFGQLCDPPQFSRSFLHFFFKHTEADFGEDPKTSTSKRKQAAASREWRRVPKYLNVGAEVDDKGPPVNDELGLGCRLSNTNCHHPQRESFELACFP